MGGGGGGGGGGPGPVRYEAPCALFLVARGSQPGEVVDRTVPTSVPNESEPEKLTRLCGLTGCSAFVNIEINNGDLSIPEDAKSNLAASCIRLASGDIRPKPQR